MTHPLEATLENRDDAWVLTLVRDFRQPAEKLWPWLTEPDRLRQWSPIVPDRALDSVGPRQVRENPDDEPVTGEVVRTRNNAAGSRCATSTPNDSTSEPAQSPDNVYSTSSVTLPPHPPVKVVTRSPDS
jgi:hypothetical protein